MGPHAVPRGAPHADFEGGRITMYTTKRPFTPAGYEQHRSAAGSSLNSSRRGDVSR